MKDEPIIHLWSPGSWHEPQYIIGNKTGLEQLAALIEKVLKQKDSRATSEFFINDGEGHDIVVKCVPEKDVYTIAAPYTEEYAQEHRENAIYPYGGNNGRDCSF